MDDKDREIQKTKEYNYVLWAVIALLCVTLVNLFAQQTCTNEIFVAQVSFASTISSIILSVIAIIMTVVSNDSISSLLHKVRDLHDNIKDVPTDIKKTAEDLNSSVAQLNSLENKLNEIPYSIEKNISTLKILLDEAVKKIDGIDERTKDINSSLFENNNYKKSRHYTNNILKENSLDSFINSLPEAVLLTIYICISAYNKSTSFTFPDIAESLHIKNYREYLSAVMFVFRSLGLINFNQDESLNNKITMINQAMIPLIEQKMSKGFLRKLKDMTDAYFETIVNGKD